MPIIHPEDYQLLECLNKPQMMVRAEVCLRAIKDKNKELEGQNFDNAPHQQPLHPPTSSQSPSRLPTPAHSTLNINSNFNSSNYDSGYNANYPASSLSHLNHGSNFRDSRDQLQIERDSATGTYNPHNPLCVYDLHKCSSFNSTTNLSKSRKSESFADLIPDVTNTQNTTILTQTPTLKSPMTPSRYPLTDGSNFVCPDTKKLKRKSRDKDRDRDKDSKTSHKSHKSKSNRSQHSGYTGYANSIANSLKSDQLERSSSKTSSHHKHSSSPAQTYVPVFIAPKINLKEENNVISKVKKFENKNNLKHHHTTLPPPKYKPYPAVDSSVTSEKENSVVEPRENKSYTFDNYNVVKINKPKPDAVISSSLKDKTQSLTNVTNLTPIKHIKSQMLGTPLKDLTEGGKPASGSEKIQAHPVTTSQENSILEHSNSTHYTNMTNITCTEYEAVGNV